MSERLHFSKFIKPPVESQVIYRCFNNEVDPLKDPRLVLDKALYELLGQNGLVCAASEARCFLAIINAFSTEAYDRLFSSPEGRLHQAISDDIWFVVNKVVERLTVPIGFSSFPWLPSYPIPVDTPIFPQRGEAGNKHEDLFGTWRYYRALVSRYLDNDRTLFALCLIEHVGYHPASSRVPLVRLNFDIPPENIGDQDVFRNIEVVGVSTDPIFSETTRSYGQTGEIYTRHTGFCGSLAPEKREMLTQAGFPPDTNLPPNIFDFKATWDKLVRCASDQTPITLADI